MNNGNIPIINISCGLDHCLFLDKKQRLITFGENDLYKPIIPNPPGSTLNKVQTWFKDQFSFVIPFIRGGPLFGTLPRRKPLHTVIGKPIKIQQVDNPSLQHILEIHKLYVERLQDLYDRWKYKND